MLIQRGPSLCLETLYVTLCRDITVKELKDDPLITYSTLGSEEEIVVLH